MKNNIILISGFKSYFSIDFEGEERFLEQTEMNLTVGGR